MFIVCQGYRIFNTWVGDPGKVALLEAVVKVIQKEGLLDQVVITGSHLLHGLENLQVISLVMLLKWCI